MVLGKGGNTGLMCLHLLLTTHLNPCFFAPSESPLIPLVWTGLLFQGPAGSCLSLQVPGRCLKIPDHTFHILHHGINVLLCYI